MILSCISMGIFYFYDYENISFQHLIYTMLLELIQLSHSIIMCNDYIYSHQTGWTSLILEFLHLVSTVLFSCNLNSVKLMKVKSPYHLILCPGNLPVSFALFMENANTKN